MPAMMGNQPMKDSYVGGLEKSLAKKMKAPKRPVNTLPTSRSPIPMEKGPRVGVEGVMQPKKTPVVPPMRRRPQGRDKILKNGRPMFGKFGI